MTDDASRASRTPRDDRSTAEWVTFALSCLVLAVVVALVSVNLVREQDPAAPSARPIGPVVERADGFHVPVEVRNEGDEGAADVQVVAELTIDGETTEGDLTIDFLPGDASDQVTFVFDDDPASGDLVVRIAGYSEP